MDSIYLTTSCRSPEGAQKVPSLATREHCFSIVWKIVWDSNLNIFGPCVATIPPVEEEDPFHGDFPSIIKGEPGCVLIFGVAQASDHTVNARACSENILCGGKERSNWSQLITLKLVSTPELTEIYFSTTSWLQRSPAGCHSLCDPANPDWKKWRILEKARGKERDWEIMREKERDRVRDVFRKKRYYVGIIPTWEDPPPSPSMGIFSTKYHFFLKMSQSEKI